MTDTLPPVPKIGTVVQNNYGNIYISQHNEQNAQLFLENPISRRGVSRFHYRSDAITFIGREDELAKLHEFCDTSADKVGDRLSIWLITGAGGLGKSRLARQLCMDYAEKGWVTGFYSRRQEKGIPEDWTPVTNTLIVIDYASQIQVLKDRLHTWQNSTQDRWQHSVRVLLLERDEKHLASLITHNQGRPLSLVSLTDNMLHQLMKQVYQDSNVTSSKPPLPNSHTFLQALRQVDPASSRPLFAAYIADALANSEQPDDRYSLLSYVAGKDQERWANLFPNQDQERKQYERLLYLSTLVHGLGSDILSTLSLLPDFPPDLLPDLHTFDRHRFSEMAGQETTAGYIPALEPDIYGGWFLLNVPESKNVQEETELNNLHLLAWKAKSSKIAYVISWLKQDFPFFEKTTTFKEKLMAIARSQLSDKTIRERLVLALYNCTLVEPDAGKRVALAAEIRELHDKYSQENMILGLLAAALHNCTEVEPNVGKRALLAEEIRELHNAYGQESMLRERLAKALLNCTVVEPNAEERRVLAAEIRELHNTYGQETAVRHWLAAALYNCTVVELDVGRRTALAVEIRELHDKYGQESMVREHLTRALLNCTVVEPKAEERRVLAAEIRELHNAYGQETVARQCLATALYNCTVVEPDLGRRTALAEEIRELHDKYGQESGVREQLTEALFSCTVVEPNTEIRVALATEIRELHNAYGQESMVREHLTKALLNCMVVEPDAEKRLMLAAEIRELHNGYGQEGIVRERLAIALYNCTIVEPITEKRLVLATEIRELHNTYGQESVVREQLAKALLNCTVNEPDIEKRGSLAAEIRELHSLYGQESVVRERLAKALFNCTVDEPNVEKRTLLAAEIRELHDRYGQENGVREWLAGALYNCTLVEPDTEKRAALDVEIQKLHNW